MAFVEPRSINQDAVKAFGETYLALITTLADTYKDKALQSIVQLYVEEKKDFLETGQEFWSDLREHVNKVCQKDERLFSQSIPSLDRLTVTSLWNNRQLSPNSQKYIWMYLSTLIRHARDIDPDEQDPVDIAPPDMPSIDKIYDNLPKGVLDKVKQVADKYGEKIESGEQSMDDIRFDEISKELFENMSQEDMSGLVSNVGNVLQSLMGGNAQMEDIFKAMGKQ
jgi:hypothetical protein